VAVAKVFLLGTERSPLRGWRDHPNLCGSGRSAPDRS